MPKSLPLLAMAGLLASTGCGSFEPPPNQPAMQLHYPTGVGADLINHNPGDSVPIVAVVTDHGGKPVPGIEVIWDDNRWPIGAQPSRVLSDSLGRARTLWILRPLSPGTFSDPRSIRAYLPGAANSPLEYRTIVMPCSKCP